MNREEIICLDNKFSTTRRVIKTINKIECDSVKCGGLRMHGYIKKSSRSMPLISIVTVVYNGAEFLEETILSILKQSYSNIEYIIIDGNSTDETLNIIKKYDNQIDYWLSEPDSGMYEALSKGFSYATGDIFAWLNADDLYYSYSLEVVANIFLNNRNVQWLTGVNSHIDTNSVMINVSCPQVYFQYFIKHGYYNGKILEFIQQESTFFKASLYKTVQLSNKLKLAADYDLWIQFAKYQRLYTVKTILASFRIHQGQKSEDLIKYQKECESVSKNKKIKLVKYMLKPLSILLFSKFIRPNISKRNQQEMNV